MTYQFYPQNNDKLCRTERHSHSPIAYCSKRKMEKLYPRGGYEVIGEIGNYTKRQAFQDVIQNKEGKTIPIFPRGSLKKPFEWVAGYAAVGENMYVAVIKGIIPRLL